MASNKTWSEEDTIKLRDLYSSEKDNIGELATYFGKNPRQIIAKLSSLKIYKKVTTPLRTGNKTVKMLIMELEGLLDIRLEILNLNRKENLETLVDAIRKVIENNATRS